MGARQIDRTRSAMARAVRRAVAPLRARRGAVVDPNFIGFDKYRRHGAYHWRELQERPDYRSKIELVAQYSQPTDRCLDVGCGDGAYAYALSARVAEVVGIDADYDAVRLARRELRRHHVHTVTCHQLAIADLSLDAVSAAGPFDLVYSMDVVEHLPRPEELLERAVAVVRPGGRILVGTPRYLGDDLMSPYHVREYTPDELVELVSRDVVIDAVHLLPMRRMLTTGGSDVFHDDGFVVVAGTPR